MPLKTPFAKRANLFALRIAGLVAAAPAQASIAWSCDSPASLPWLPAAARSRSGLPAAACRRSEWRCNDFQEDGPHGRIRQERGGRKDVPDREIGPAFGPRRRHERGGFFRALRYLPNPRSSRPGLWHYESKHGSTKIDQTPARVLYGHYLKVYA